MKFDKAMIMYTHAFNSTKNKYSDNKEVKDERLQTALYTDLSNYWNEKDQVYKTIHSTFSKSFQSLDEGCIFLPLGVNNLHIRVTPNNIGSIIGFALSSNIYFDGLVYFNYLNLKNKLLIHNESMKLTENEDDPYFNYGKIKHDTSSTTPVVVQDYRVSTSHLSKEDGTDVFDSPVPASHIEKELQKGNKENFIFSFSNHNYDDIQMHIELESEKEEFQRTQDSKYYNKPKTGLDSIDGLK